MSILNGTLIGLAAFLFIVGCAENTPTGDDLLDDDAAPINEINGGDADTDADADSDTDSDSDGDADDTGEFIEVDTYSTVDWEQIANDWRFDEPDLEYGLCRGNYPSGTEFTCEFYTCRFLESRVFEESNGYLPTMCQDSEWTCDKCYYELFECLKEEEVACDEVDDLRMYKVMDNFRECYLDVTGFDRCRWIMPDVCEGISECSGPEWPPI